MVPLALGGLGIGTTEFVMMGLLPDIAKDFQIDIPTAGHLISAYAVYVTKEDGMFNLRGFELRVIKPITSTEELIKETLIDWKLKMK